MSKTGNPITQAINRGIQKVDTSTPCETASEINKSQRETLKEKPDRIRGRTQELKDGSVLEGCGVTNATAIFSDTFSITSTSNYTAQTFDVINRVAEGNKPKNRPDGSPLACQEEPHQYAGNDSNYSKTCNGGHAEARILDTLVLNTDQFGGLEGKSLIFNIDWRSGPQGEKKFLVEIVLK